MSVELTSPQKVAAFLLGIDTNLAAEVMRRMNEDHVELVAQAMKELEEVALDEGDVRAIFKEAVTRMRGAGLALGDVGGTIKHVLAKAFGEDKGAALLDEVEHKTLARKPFDVFAALPEDELAGLLLEEHPQITAVFLAHLDAAKAAEVLGRFPDEKQVDVLRRIATLGRSNPEVVQRVVEVMRAKVKELGISTVQSEPKGWIKKAAHILNFMGAAEKEVLDAIAEQDETLAEKLRDEMFTFDDLAKLDKKSMQKVLGSIDTAVLALALKACSPEVEENIFNNLSKRAREIVIDERDAKGPTPISEVLEAQKSILATVRSLIESGDIPPVGSGAEQLV